MVLTGTCAKVLRFSTNARFHCRDRHSAMAVHDWSANNVNIWLSTHLSRSLIASMIHSVKLDSWRHLLGKKLTVSKKAAHRHRLAVCCYAQSLECHQAVGLHDVLRLKTSQHRKSKHNWAGSVTRALVTFTHLEWHHSSSSCYQQLLMVKLSSSAGNTDRHLV